ncbi:MAG TPA: hypothetical protein VFD32_03115 [Dehalococcoidia bacterium]|nr:hypothetical protein [Dehalococcoidia bacterium]
MTAVLPYDGSAVARAALRRLAEPAYRRWLHGRLLLVLPAGPRCAALRRRSEARRIAGPALELRFRLATGDPATLAQRIAQSATATFVAPVPAHGASRWYRAVAGVFLTGTAGRSVALHLDGSEFFRGPRTALPPRRVTRGATRPRRPDVLRCRGSFALSGAQEVEP